jgi:NAD(P)-dependent dehydrogenase (short-subunit alcohol dehydrogenase family)
MPTPAPSPLFDLTGRVIIVTGATGVLAGSAARYLVAQGARVVFLGRDQTKLDAARADCIGLPGEAAAFSVDVLDRTGLENVRAEVVARFGRIDALINAAGGNQPGATIPPDKTFFDLDLAAYRQVLALNLEGTVLPSQVFAQTFAAQKRGNIINFSSMAAERAISRVVGYSNAKAAVDNFTRWLAVEFAAKYGDGLRVNAIAPGFFIADQNRRLLLNPDGTPTARGQAVLNQTPFRRFDGGFSCFSGV